MKLLFSTLTFSSINHSWVPAALSGVRFTKISMRWKFSYYQLQHYFFKTELEICPCCATKCSPKTLSCVMSKEVIVVSCRSSDVFWTLFILIHFLPRVSVRPAKTSAKLRTRVKIGKQFKENNLSFTWVVTEDWNSHETFSLTTK